MNIAMTVWGDRISPVLDCARELLIVEVDRGEILNRRREVFDLAFLAPIMRFLRCQEVRALICGAVSQEPASLIESSGIELIPFLSGDVEKILRSYLRGESMSAFVMPGCRCHGRCRMTRKGVGRKKTTPGG